MELFLVQFQVWGFHGNRVDIAASGGVLLSIDIEVAAMTVLEKDGIRMYEFRSFRGKSFSLSLLRTSGHSGRE